MIATALTRAEWYAANTVVASGAYAFESDTGCAKKGDGVTSWRNLPYFRGDAQNGQIDAAIAFAAANPTTTTGDLIARGASGLVRVPAGMDGTGPIWSNGGVINNSNGSLIRYQWSTGDQSRQATVISSGTGAGTFFTLGGGGMGSRALTAGTTSTGRSGIVPLYFRPSAFLDFKVVAKVGLSRMPDATDDFVVFLSAQSGAGGALASATHGLWLMANYATNSMRWVLRKRVSSVDTDVNSTVTLTGTNASVANLQSVRIDVDLVGQVATAYVNGTSMATTSITDWIAVAGETGHSVMYGIEKLSGTTECAVSAPDIQFIGTASSAPNFGL